MQDLLKLYSFLLQSTASNPLPDAEHHWDFASTKELWEQQSWEQDPLQSFHRMDIQPWLLKLRITAFLKIIECWVHWHGC